MNRSPSGRRAGRRHALRPGARGAKGTATIGKDTIAAFYVDESKPYPKGPVAFLTIAGGRHGEFEPVLKNPGPGRPTPHVTYDALVS
jgi:hypothetical protein